MPRTFGAGKCRWRAKRPLCVSATARTQCGLSWLALRTAVTGGVLFSDNTAAQESIGRPRRDLSMPIVTVFALG